MMRSLLATVVLMAATVVPATAAPAAAGCTGTLLVSKTTDRVNGVYARLDVRYIAATGVKQACLTKIGRSGATLYVQIDVCSEANPGPKCTSTRVRAMGPAYFDLSGGTLGPVEAGPERAKIAAADGFCVGASGYIRTDGITRSVSTGAVGC